jgi:hypothetical protein
MHSFDAKGGATFNFNPDLSGEVGITTRSGREVWVDGADLIEFMRHVEPMRRADQTYDDFELHCLADAESIYVRDGTKTVTLASLTAEQKRAWIDRWWESRNAKPE